VETLFREAIDRERFQDGMSLLMTASQLRESFSELAQLKQWPEPAQLARGPMHPKLICFSSNKYQYSRFAAGLEAIRDVFEVMIPGFTDTQLPSSGEIAAEVLAQVIQENLSSEPFVLVGCLFGSLVAQLTAAHLERLGLHPSGLVLLDPPTQNWCSQSLYAISILTQATEYPVPGTTTDEQLATIGRYLQIHQEYQAIELATPNLVLRSEPLDSAKSLNSSIDARGGTHVPAKKASSPGQCTALTALRVNNWLLDRINSAVTGGKLS
jgi:thioesterase domain-containing protein